VNVRVFMRDGRLLARVINLAFQFGCSYTKMSSGRNDDGSLSATIELDGPPDALRRLNKKITALLLTEKEIIDENLL
jgi:hypothetical protein